MNEKLLLEKVKSALGITGDFLDGQLQIHIDEVKEYMIDAGVSAQFVEDYSAIGTIIRGVLDLWNNGSGNAELSSYFKARITQLKYKEV